MDNLATIERNDHTRALTLVDHGAGFQEFLHRVHQAPILTLEEETNLALRYRQERDLDAAHQLVWSHLRLVVKTAREYLGYRVQLSELVQEGTLGLMHAVKRFDPHRGARLATYALWWIRAAIHEFILRAWSMVKVATTQVRRRLFFKLRQAKESSAPLTPDEAEELAVRFQTDAATILEMDGRLAGGDESLNRPLLDDASGELLDLIPDQRPNQEVAALSREKQRILTRLIEQGLAGLDPRERQVVEARIMSDQPATLEDLGAQLRVSRERVRQLESRAMKKLRAFFAAAPEEARLVLGRA
ncbi:MAG: RNA polymerase factor sigma-32 [Magnetococcales bacterium]|nr:RNA polymerase factor sigma-32 [Magnetococcales bacterium]